MRDPKNSRIKAWAAEYNEPSFFFGRNFDKGSRLIAWSEEPELIERAFYEIVESMSESLSLMVKICSERDEQGNTTWTTYRGDLPKQEALDVFRQNEEYVFSDGMHQLWVKDALASRYLVFDDHGVLNLYFPTSDDEQRFLSIGYQKKNADPIFSKPHFHCTKNNSEEQEINFVSNLGLKATNTQ